MTINRYRYYVGPLGFLQPLPPMSGGANAPEISITIPGALHTSLSGRSTIDRIGTPKRAWSLSWENLQETDRLLVDSLINRGNGNAPLRLIDPRVSNRLTLRVSAGGSLFSETSSFVSTGSLYDLFGATVSNDWATLTSGQTWTESPGSPSGSINDFDKASGTGTIAIQANGQTYSAVVANQFTPDIDHQFDFTVPFTDVTGGQLEIGGLMARYLDGSNHYLARVETLTNETFTISLYRIGGTGGTAQIAGPTAISGAHTSGTFMTLRMQVVGSVIRAKAWATAGSPPTGWQVTATDTGLTQSGQFGIRSSIGAGNTNAKPILVTVDNYKATISPTPSSALVYTPGLVPTVLQGVLAGGLQWNPGFAGCQLLAIEENVPVLAGSVYQFSAYVSGNANVKLIARPFDVNGVEQTTVVSAAQTVTGVMQRFSWTHTPAGGVASVQFGLEAQAAGSIQTTAWKVGIDEASLTAWSFGAGCPVVVPDPQVSASYWRVKYWRPKLTLREA